MEMEMEWVWGSALSGDTVDIEVKVSLCERPLFIIEEDFIQNREVHCS